MLIGRRHDSTVACIDLRHRDEHVSIGLLAVEPTLQNAGIGKAMLEHAETCAVHFFNPRRLIIAGGSMRAPSYSPFTRGAATRPAARPRPIRRMRAWAYPRRNCASSNCTSSPRLRPSKDEHKQLSRSRCRIARHRAHRRHAVPRARQRRDLARCRPSMWSTARSCSRTLCACRSGLRTFLKHALTVSSTTG